ncbi:MAG: bifunctional protein-disulfide isomerase/oxidoreductase DsbC [Gammaproteobacteria bacterium]|nr:bifunctional protein-disulfide isomerase/oxidoreductase DsbC [Gammaproteobacteria bacterium]
MSIKGWVLALATTVLTVSVSAAPALDEATLKARAEALVGAPVRALAPSPVEGFYEAISDGGIFYVSKDGEYLMYGKLFKMTAPVTDLTEQSYSKLRQATFAELADTAIVYPAKKPKHVLTVFTDPTCGYCRKFHEQMKQYNALGFTVRYLAFPRGGQQSPAFTEMEAIWCAKDPREAMDKAKGGQTIKTKNCANPVAEHYAAGSMLGVRGTPAVYLDDGVQVGGYISPDDLVKLIAAQQSEAKAGK